MYHFFNKDKLKTLFSFFMLLIFCLVPLFDFQIILLHRDITYLLSLLNIIYLQKRILKNESYSHSIFLLFFLGLASFSYSGDRGLYILLSSICLFGGLFFYSMRRKSDLLLAVLGILSGVIFLGVTINWAFYDYFLYFFFEMPRFKGLRSGLYFDYTSTFIIPILILSFSMFWSIRFILYQYKKESNHKIIFLNNLVLIYLCLLSFLSSYSIVSRMDITRLSKNLIPLFILVTFILLKYIKKTPVLVLTYLSCGVFFIKYLPSVDFNKLYSFSRFDDSQIVPKAYQEVSDHLKSTLKLDETFITFTNDGFWYYLVDRPSPIRFQLIYNATITKYQDEVINDLNNKNINYVIVGKGGGHWNYDGISMKVRVSKVWNYIELNFPHISYENQRFLVLKRIQR